MSGAPIKSRLREYRGTLDSHGLLDFSEILSNALMLLAQMEEFARSRYRLEGRYHHVLLDEFQDTSRAQWALVALLIRSWGEGIGVAEGAPLNPSIFLVGDRKQSIYGFRDADVAVMEEAAAFVDGLRPERDSRRAMSKSFRAVPQILAFANDLFHEIDKAETRRDAFRFGDQDRFPVEFPGSDVRCAWNRRGSDRHRLCRRGCLGDSTSARLDRADRRFRDGRAPAR